MQCMPDLSLSLSLSICVSLDRAAFHVQPHSVGGYLCVTTTATATTTAIAVTTFCANTDVHISTYVHPCAAPVVDPCVYMHVWMYVGDGPVHHSIPHTTPHHTTLDHTTPYHTALPVDHPSMHPYIHTHYALALKPAQCLLAYSRRHCPSGPLQHTTNHIHITQRHVYTPDTRTMAHDT